MSRIGVAGATGALGKEILAVLEEQERFDEVVPLASLRTSTATVMFRGSSVAVDVLDEQAMEDLDALLIAVPAEVAARAVPRALGAGRPVVDASGAFPGAIRFLPRVTPAPPAGPRLVSVPHPEAALIARVLHPLRLAGWSGAAGATVLVPASASGRDGIDELSRQVVALFSSGTPPRKVFPEGLAFDLMPAVGAIESDGWTAAERAAESSVRALVPDCGTLSVTLTRAPLFSGTSGWVTIDPGGLAPDPAAAVRQLTAAGLLPPKNGLPRSLPRPRTVEGRPVPIFGRARVDAIGRLHVWVCLDPLRCTAIAMAEALRHLLDLPDSLSVPDADHDEA